MRSWIRLENGEYNQLDGDLEDDKGILCVTLFRLRLPLVRIVGLSLLLLVICRCSVICKGFEAERDTNLIRLLEADAFFHGIVTGLREEHAQDTMTRLYLALFTSSFRVATS